MLKWAERVWDWMFSSGLFADGGGGNLVVNDGAKIANNCLGVTETRWSYNQGPKHAGCAYLYDYTQDSKWRHPTLDLRTCSRYFFMQKGNSQVMYETGCQEEQQVTCDNDQRGFKALFSANGAAGWTDWLQPAGWLLRTRRANVGVGRDAELDPYSAHRGCYSKYP